jgi:hypothetical protein
VESVSHWSRVLQFDAKGAPDRRELVGEVRAAGVGGVKVALDDERETTETRRNWA